MEEHDLTILEDLDDTILAESNSEMNNLLFQTDCMLSTAEFQLETIEAEDKTAWVGDNEPTLLINDISGDLFKGLTSELNFSSSFLNTLLNDSEPSDGKNLDEMLNESITAYNTMFDVNGNEKIHDEVDKTLTNSSAFVNKITYSTPFAVEKNINEMLEDLNCSLRAYNSVFEISGCGDLDDTLIDNQNRDISNATITCQDIDECNENKETVQSSTVNNNDSNVSTNNSHVTEDFGQNATTYQEPKAVDKPLETENSYDITEPTPSKADNHSEIIEKQSISAIKPDKLSVKQINISKHDDSTVINLVDDNTLMQPLTVTADEIVENKKQADDDTSQESNEIAERELLKRKSFEHPSTNEEKCKKLKCHHANDSNEHEAKGDNDCDDIDNTIDANFTMAIFDPNETADNIDPGWNGLRDLRSSEDYFQSVRDQWRSLSLPNPHRDITRRYVDTRATNNQQDQQQHGFQDKDRSIPCDKMIDYRIQLSHQRLVAMKNERNNLRGSPGSKMARKKINRAIDETQLLIRNLEKNREEVKQINSFYNGGLDSWDAYFLTQTQANDVQQQDKVFEFQTNFYQSQ